MPRRVAALIFAAAVLAGPAPAAARTGLVVSTDWLARRLGDPSLVILQVGDAAGYAAGHIPGARLVTLRDVSAPGGEGALILEMPDAETLRARLSALGVSDRSRIVVVPTKEGIQSATRVVFTLTAAGLGDRTVLMEGGLGAWAAERRPLTQASAPASPGKLSRLKMQPLVVDADYVRQRLSAPGYVIVDARTPEFYAGDRPGGTPGRPHKPGHIAGARNVPFTAVTTPDLRLAPREAIAAQFKAAGVKRGDTVIVYCHVGQQASATLFAARALGLKARLYDGSFEEWSRLDGAVATARSSRPARP